jgi:hypothetical protein
MQNKLNEIQAIRTNKPNFKYAQHILDTQQTYSNIQETMDILHIEKKGPLMNTLEQFHIYNLWKEKNVICSVIINHYK